MTILCARCTVPGKGSPATVIWRGESLCDHHALVAGCPRITSRYNLTHEGLRAVCFGVIHNLPPNQVSLVYAWAHETKTTTASGIPAGGLLLWEVTTDAAKVTKLIDHRPTGGQRDPWA